MTEAQIAKFIAAAPSMPTDDEKLVGYELQTTDLNPNDPHDRKFLASAIQDAIYAGTKHIVGITATGSLTLWTLPIEP